MDPQREAISSQFWSTPKNTPTSVPLLLISNTPTPLHWFSKNNGLGLSPFTVYFGLVRHPIPFNNLPQSVLKMFAQGFSYYVLYGAHPTGVEVQRAITKTYNFFFLCLGLCAFIVSLTTLFLHFHFPFASVYTWCFAKYLILILALFRWLRSFWPEKSFLLYASRPSSHSVGVTKLWKFIFLENSYSVLDVIKMWIKKYVGTRWRRADSSEKWSGDFVFNFI